MAEKTNASRILESLGINFTLVPYKVDEEHLDAIHVAEELNEAIETVYKTLVLYGDKTGHLVCVIRGDKEIDLKKIARISGNKKVAMIPMKELLPLTGYIRGGCTAIGMKKSFPVYIDRNVMLQKFIYISAGKRGLQIKLRPEDYIKVTSAVIGDLINN